MCACCIRVYIVFVARSSGGQASLQKIAHNLDAIKKLRLINAPLMISQVISKGTPTEDEIREMEETFVCGDRWGPTHVSAHALAHKQAHTYTHSGISI